MPDVNTDQRGAMSTWATNVTMGIGCLLVALGLALIPLPGPGWLVLILGVIVFAGGLIARFIRTNATPRSPRSGPNSGRTVVGQTGTPDKTPPVENSGPEAESG